MSNYYDKSKLGDDLVFPCHKKNTKTQNLREGSTSLEFCTWTELDERGTLTDDDLLWRKSLIEDNLL